MIGRWYVVDALADEDEQIDKTPYAYGWNNPVNLTDPDGNCPMCLTALVGGLVGGGIELGGQIIGNLVSGNKWNDIDYADVAIASGEGALIGLTGGLGAAGKLGTTAVKAINISTKVAAAAGQGVVDVKTEGNGGIQTVFNGKKTVKAAGIDAGVNLLGAALGGKSPKGNKPVSGPFKAPTPSAAVKTARAKGPVNRAARIAIEKKAIVKKKAANIANETIKSPPTGVSGAVIENVTSDKLKQ